MSSNNASGVRNLRAMFENKASSDQSISPPSRGRSPLDTDNSENSRAVSKVRATFVAVEKLGQPGQPPQWGLRKASDVSNISGVNGNIIEDSPLHLTSSRKAMMATQDQMGQNDLGLILKGSPFDDKQIANVGQAEDPGQTSSSDLGQMQESETVRKKNASSQDKTALTAVKTKTSTMNTKPKSPTEQKDAIKTVPPVTVPSTKQLGAKTSEKSPGSPQSPQAGKVKTTHQAPSIKGIRGGPAKIIAVMDSANKARAEREKRSPVIATKASGTDKKDSVAQASPTKRIKKPTSPEAEKVPRRTSQPTSVPAATTASATASAAHTDKPPKSLNSDNRRVSAVRRDNLPPPRVARTSTASSLAKKTSRTSLVPKTNGHERPRSRVSTAKEESFLARMTRPTASSQQKVHEKVVKADSPPRARKVTDMGRRSLGVAKDMDEDKENNEAKPLEPTKLNPEVEEQKPDVPTETAVAQEAI